MGIVALPDGTLVDDVTGAPVGPGAAPPPQAFGPPVPVSPGPNANNPSIAGWAKSVILGGKPQATVPLSDVPSIIAGAPKAALNAAAESAVAPPKSPDASGGPIPEKGDAGGGADRSELDAENEAIAKETRLRMAGMGAGAPAAYFEPEGSSKARIGGPELYNEAFVNAPARRQTAMQDLGVVQTDRAKELAAMYDRQAVQDQKAAEAMAVRQQNEQEELHRRQEELAKATKYYSRDLADQGKFWTNPGNIIAAISYSLMPIFSNDPTVGVKLINQAVQQDLDNRQRAADTTLGAMRSNIDGYRKIAGDRQAGDLLARSEAHRMAAQEIERIGAKFSGPEAQKAMQVAVEDQKTRASAAEMEFYAKHVWTPAQKSVPGMTAARYQGPGGWAPLGQQPKYGTAIGGGGAASPVNGELAGGPTQVATKDMAGAPPVVKALVRTGGAPALDRLLANPKTAGKLTDSQVEAAVEMAARQEAQLLYPNQPGGYLKVIHDSEKKLEPVAMELSKKAGTRALIADVRSKMDIVRRSEMADGKDPEEFLSWAREALPSSWVLEYQKFTAKDPSSAKSEAERRTLYRRQKTEQLRSELQGVFNAHNHELFGGAQTEKGSGGGEIGRGLQEIGPKSSFALIQSHLDGRSRQLQKEVTELKAGLDPMARILLRHRTNSDMSASRLPQQGQPGPLPQ